MSDEEYFSDIERFIYHDMYERELVFEAQAVEDTYYTYPARYQVVLVNDEYTPVDFIIVVLETFFNHVYDEAAKVMLRMHNDGKAVCGTYTKDVAETKVMQVIEFARQNEYPLKCVVQKEPHHVIKKS